MLPLAHTDLHGLKTAEPDDHGTLLATRIGALMRELSTAKCPFSANTVLLATAVCTNVTRNRFKGTRA